MRSLSHIILPTLSAVATLAALALTAAPAAAQSGVFSIGNVVNANPGGTGSFDILLTTTDGSLSVGGFSVQPFVASGGSVLFTDVNFSTATPYIFQDSFDQDTNSPLSYSTLPSSTFNASDTDGSTTGATPLASSQTVGLAHVTFRFAGGDAPGSSYTVGFNTDPAFTSLSDGTGAISYPFTATPGTLTVGTAAPEPAGWATISCMALGIVGLLFKAGRRLAAVSQD